jgi:hypothetical protein
VNITPAHEFKKKQHLSKKERRRLRKEAAKSTSFYGYDWEEHWKQKQEAERGFKSTPSWSTSSETNDVKSTAITVLPKQGSNVSAPRPWETPAKTWPAPAASRDPDLEDTQELPIVPLKAGRLWANADINEILQELRVFNWRSYGMVRPKLPSFTV